MSGDDEVPSSDAPARTALPRAVTILVGAAALVICVAGIRGFSGTLGPTLLALILVVTLQPVQSWLQRRGAPNWVGILALLAVIYAILLGLTAALALSVAQLVTLLPKYSGQFGDMLLQATQQLDKLGVDQDQINTALDKLDLSNLVGVLQRVLGGVTTVLSDLFFLVILIVFLGMDAAGFPRRLAAAAASRPQLIDAFHSFASGTRRYMWVSTIFGLIVAVIDIGALYWLAVPLPLLWGLLSFITNYIPNIGFVLGLVPPALLGLLEGGVSTMIWVIVAYSVINVVIQSIIQPKFVGDAVGLSVTLTFLSLVFWSFALGALGALLAIPLSLLVKAVLVDADPKAQWVRPLLGDTGLEKAKARKAAADLVEPQDDTAPETPATEAAERPA